MNWEAIGTIAEVAAAGGVIISLLYLAKQIRAQTRESRLAAAHEIAEGFRDILLPFADADLCEVFVRANTDFDGLTDAERVQMIAVNSRNIRVWEEAYHQFKGGRLDENIWNTIVRQYSSYLSAPSFLRVWELRSAFYDDEFREFVDSLDRAEYKIK
jgi:hypothetical protein